MNDLRKLREFRRAKGISLKELSVRTGLSRQSLSRMEKGEGNPSYGSVVSVISELGYELRVVM